MPEPSVTLEPGVTILSPMTGATVGRPFVASGTYQSENPFPAITAVLKDSAGTAVATGMVSAGGGTWSAAFNPSQGYTGASIVAALTGTPATATASNLTIT